VPLARRGPRGRGDRDVKIAVLELAVELVERSELRAALDGMTAQAG
jgi:hypothetical protein